jgi:hypothetical protein
MLWPQRGADEIKGISRHLVKIGHIAARNLVTDCPFCG